MDYAALAEQAGRMQCEGLKELGRLAGLFAAQGESSVLLCLRRRNESMLSGELMERLGLTTGRVANLLRQMERKGLVLRRQDQSDRRRVYVVLTGLGEEAAEAQYRAVMGASRRLLEYLGEDDARELLRLMKRCMACMRALPDGRH